MKPTFVRPSRQSVENALKAIEDVMNIFHHQYGNIKYMYKQIIFSDGGEALDCFLSAGVHFYELRRKVALGKLSGDALVQEIMSFQ
jgi:hypothetical protein